ncbi:MAG: hypothetical protein K2M34_00510 [Alphaproteobacteria bacterium]|nr:hypothetical protein [Alphaproteobacteria bacterium]
MLKNLFKRGKSQVEHPAKPAAREFKPTKKMKNTYIVQLNTMTMPGAFELCPNTPLAVIKINGIETDNAKGGFMSCTQFPNPGASAIESVWHNAPEWRIIMGSTATTIIEYLDKKSGKPALILYPTGHVQSLIANEDANKVIGTRLNHASRRDFIYQYNKIIELVEIVNPLIDIRNQAMRRAPQNYEARQEFFTELNRAQIERAKQIVAARQK